MGLRFGHVGLNNKNRNLRVSETTLAVIFFQKKFNRHIISTLKNNMGRQNMDLGRENFFNVLPVQPLPMGVSVIQRCYMRHIHANLDTIEFYLDIRLSY